MKALKIILTTLSAGFILALVIFNIANPVESDSTVWNNAMTKGNPEAKNHFIMYTDIFCPYCDKFSNALTANADDFATNYLDNDQVFWEMRVTQINYLTGHSDNSQPAGEAAYCAARQNKFWGYYEAILAQIYADYHSKGIGIDKNAPKIPTLELDYFVKPAETAQLNMTDFNNCFDNHKTLTELESATDRASRQIESGVPYFVFGDFRTSGFAGNWDTTNDYAQAKLLLNAGLTQ